jgi:O-glycosyl hydrolase
MRFFGVRSAATFSMAVLLCVGADSFAQQPATITLDGASPTHTFEGLGALSAGASSRLLVDYPEPQRSQILDYLFKPNYGAALQHLKVEDGADVNSTDGAEPSHMRTRTDRDYTRGYEWWLMEEAKKRNPHIILDILPWGAPGWVGNGKLYSQDMADYTADFIEGAWKVHHLHIDYAGIWNERAHDVAYIKMLHDTFAAHHLTTKIVCCDEVYNKKLTQWKIADEIERDPVLKADVDVLGVHYPHDQLTNATSTTAAARASGKPMWDS